MRILITNQALTKRAGSELYVRDLALGLLARGHTPIVYSTELGEVAEEIRNATIPVVSDLDKIGAAPDVIHGQHHLETMTALMHFADAPAVYFCHGWLPWQEQPPKFPRIIRYLAVDDTCRDRLVFEHGIPEEQTEVLLNFVDLKQFKSRDSLPLRPKRAAVFSNHPAYAKWFQTVREACAARNIELDVIGWSDGEGCARPQDLLGNYDLVFAKGRAALEALAVGAAVILCDAKGAGPLVKTENIRQLRPLNFGVRTLRNPVDVASLTQEISRYDSNDAAKVSEFIRADADCEPVIDRLVSVYQEVLSQHKSHQDPSAERRAVALYLHELSSRFQALYEKETRLDGMEASRSWKLVSRYINLKRKLQRTPRNGRPPAPSSRP